MGFQMANLDGQAVLWEDGDYWELGVAPRRALARPEELHARWERRGRPDGQARAAELGPPVPDPQKVLAYGLNYLEHVNEMGREVSDEPVVFTKFPSCLAGPTAEVRLAGERCDYECELVLVIGAEASHVTPEQAWDFVAGLMIGQDISDRNLQLAASPPQFSLGKSRDTFGPTGPAVVSPDLLADPDDLAIECRVNGELRQNSRTSMLMRPVSQIVSYLSAALTLQPGDLVFTGTPSGVGYAQGRYLQSGDVVTSTIEGLGSLHNTCR